MKVFEDDDEPISTGVDDDASADGDISKAYPQGKLRMRVTNKKNVTLEETRLKLLVELTEAAKSLEDMPGEDIVMVLDVSMNMRGNNFKAMKTAMRLMINALSPHNRLSIITVSNKSERLCPLRQMTQNTAAQMVKQVENLRINGRFTNLAVGLEMALKILNNRKYVRGRYGAIILMSSRGRSPGTRDAREVIVNDFPIYTIGFGMDCDPEVLNNISNRSRGGMFSLAIISDDPIEDLRFMKLVLSQMLAGLLSEVVQDVKLTFTPLKDKQNYTQIKKVTVAGNPQYMDDAAAAGSVTTVSLNDFYCQQQLKVFLDTVLPAVHWPKHTNILSISCSYWVEDQSFNAPPVLVNVNRLRPEPVAEMDDILLVPSQISESHTKLSEYKNLLEGLVGNESASHPMIKKSRSYEVEHRPMQIYDYQETQTNTRAPISMEPLI